MKSANLHFAQSHRYESCFSPLVSGSRFERWWNKLGLVLAAGFFITCISSLTSAQTTLFQQDFSSSTVVSDYVNLTTPNSGQFNAIATTGAVTAAINSGALEFTRPSNNDAGSFSRTSDLASPPPTALIYKMDLSVFGNSPPPVTSAAAFFQIGSGFGIGTSAEANTATYGQFGVVLSGTNGSFQIRNIGGNANSADFSGTQTITWVLNNSGATLSYTAPDATTETAANDTADIWVGTTKVFNDMAVTTATQSMTDLKFAFTSDIGTIRIDNIQVVAPLSDNLFYRSVASGNWNSAATWESSSDNAIFSAATHAPNSDSNVITIRSPHTVTVTSDVPVDQVVIDSGGQVTINSGINWTLVNGSGTDLTIDGTLLNSGLALFASGGPTWIVHSGGTYIHNTTAGIATPIAGASLDPTSNFIYRGSSTITPALSTSGRTYGNLSFESTSGSYTVGPTGGGTLTVNGNFSIGAGVTLNVSQTGIMTFAGNFTNNGTLTNDGTTTQIYSFTGSGKTISGSGATTFETWNVNSGASITLGSNVSIASTFTGTISGTLNCGTNVVSGAGNFSLASGGTLGIGSVDGITSSGATGNIQNTGTRTFNTGGSYNYNGTTGAQVTGNGLPSTVSNLTINNSAGVGLTSSVAVSSSLTLTSGTFSIGANTLTISNPIAGTPTNLAGGSTSSVTIAGASTGVNLPSSISALNNFTLNNANGTTLPGPLTLSGTLTLSNGALSIGANTLTLDGAISAASGTLIGGSSSNITFGGVGATTALPSVTLNDLTINRPNGISLAGNVTVGGILTLNGDIATTDSFVLIENGTSSGTGDVVGIVRRTDVNATAKPFGNPNVQLANNGAANQVDVILVKGTAPSGFSSAVLRTYTLIESGGDVSSATVRLRYVNPGELNGNTPANLHLYRNSGTWTDQGAPTNTGADWIENTGVGSFSSWALADGGLAPTAVKLAKFGAASYTDGVLLNWESGYEVNNLGYHIYRDQNGKRSRVTQGVVAGSALTVGQGTKLRAGYSYSWFDAKGTPDTSYYLEAIDLNGSRDVAGPIYPYAAPNGGLSPKGQRALLLKEIASTSRQIRAQADATNSSGPNDSAARTWDSYNWPASMKTEVRAELGKLTTQGLAVQQAIAAGKAVKIGVNHTGWYRLTQPELVAAGFDPNSDARLLQMYVDGEEVPILLSSPGARLTSADKLEFYGVGLDTPTTDTHVYWLITGRAAGKRISPPRKYQPYQPYPQAQISARSFELTTERREKFIYFANLLNGDAENLFGAPVLSEPVDQSLTVRNLDNSATTAEPQLEITLQGLTAGSHQVQLQLNDTEIGMMTFADRQHPVQRFTVNRALLRDGENLVSLRSTGGEADISLIDSIRLSYAHQYHADDNALRFSAAGGQTQRVEGFTSGNIRVIDVTNPSVPLDVAARVGAAADGSYAVTVQPVGNGTRTLIAFADDLAGQPAAMEENKPSAWNAASNAADLVIITHKDFRQAVEPLATLRRNQGMAVALVDVEDVYDEFSYGAHTPAAIKNFLMSATSNWIRKPEYLLLVGDSSWDPRNYLSEGNNDFVPTKLIDTGYLETGSDDWLSDFNGTGLASMAIGRLPGRTAAEVSLMVTKILSYEQERELGGPLRGAVMVSDNGFEAQSTRTSALLPSSLTVQTINRAEVGNDAVMRGQIVDALNQGPMIVNYYGHGSVGVWTGAGLLDKNVATNLTNANRLSLYVMMTCLNGYAHDAYGDSLAESALKAPNGGAVAVWASSGFTDSQPQFLMDTEFYRLLFGSQSLRLGEATRNAKTTITDLDVRRTWTLLGDPTMRLR